MKMDKLACDARYVYIYSISGRIKSNVAQETKNEVLQSSQFIGTLNDKFGLQ